jgi:hypothetical protein
VILPIPLAAALGNAGRVTHQALGSTAPCTSENTARRRFPAGRGARELALVLVLYAAYSLSRLLADDAVTPAVARAAKLHDVEYVVGLDWEHAVNHWFVQYDVLGIVGCFWYAAAHYLVTAAVLVWLYRRGAADYVPARRALTAATVLALGVYLLMPVAPPRLLGGPFVDVLHLHAAQGWWGAHASAPRGLGGFTNELAAMPSLHAGWALWVALVVHRLARRRWSVLAWTHALVTAVVVVGTGNHWVLDVLVGWGVVLLGFLAVQLASTATAVPRVVHREIPVSGWEVRRLRG